ncbi:TadE family type IV pilus minor pilin [Sinomonas gamaensis]|uniref:TadE family type IV pilus minor pilin n=1 Tax=Sinomonas gamaensis TaxID=2565624 RepID=UPI001109F7F3|nr:TadE family type IV pilus minor pilin [Sinomonas gamaensis]
MTAELALGILAVVPLLGFLVTALTAGIMQVRAEEAVRAAAREVARGEMWEAASVTVRSVAGDGAEPSFSTDGSVVTVTVRIAVPGPIASAAGMTAQASAKLPLEESR